MVDAAALRFFSSLGSAAQDFIRQMDEELTEDERDQVMQTISRKIISCRIRVIEERHFRQHPPPEGDPMTEGEVEAAVNGILSGRTSDS